MLEINDFKNVSLQFIKNDGLNKLGRGLLGVGVGFLSYSAFTKFVPGMSDERYDIYNKIVAAVGIGSSFGALLMLDASENKNYLVFSKDKFRHAIDEYMKNIE